MSGLDATAIRQALDADPIRIARSLLGDENRATSSRTEKRWGRKGSLSLKGALWFDHEVGMGGDLLSLIQHVENCDFPQALEIAADLLGGGYERPVESKVSARRSLSPADQPDSAEQIREIWRGTLPAAGSLVELYLSSRRLALPQTCTDIRFHPECPRGRDRLPAMVAAMRDIGTNEICGLHRTYLRPDGSGKAEVTPAKMMLGRSKGAAIKLSDDADVTIGLHIAEGIETSLALLGFEIAPVWALGSAGAIRAFPVLAGIEALTIAVDNDASGVGAAAAEQCGERWQAADREVRFIKSTVVGEDLADIPGRAAS